MAIGKNKNLNKGKKGSKKKTVDPFSRKDWFAIKAPAPFDVRNVGVTCVNRSTGLTNAHDELKGRILDVSLADLKNSEDYASRRIRLRIDEIQGTNALTDFEGLEFASDKLRSFVRKWQTLIECNVTVKTSDDYLVRLFVIAFTRRSPSQIKKTTYAQGSQVRQIRKTMADIMTREAANCTLNQLVAKLVPDVISDEIVKSTKNIFPLQNVHVRKVKLLKQPKFDLANLLSLHGEASTSDSGRRVAGEFKERVLSSV